MFKDNLVILYFGSGGGRGAKRYSYSMEERTGKARWKRKAQSSF